MTGRVRTVALLVVLAAGLLGAISAFPRGGGPTAPLHAFSLVFPEGLTRDQMAHRVRTAVMAAERTSGTSFALTDRGYLAATASARVPCFGGAIQPSLEGFLFPATYDFDAMTTPRQLVDAQLKAFCRAWKTLSLSQAHSRNLTPYDVLTIASMIEREVAVPRERSLVAGVVYNRLRAGMPLGLDATLRYGLHIPAGREIRASQLADPTPYNTRVHVGLPPTPIANPGLAAMHAAAHPASVEYLYFVLEPGTRRSFFAASAKEFYAYECAHGYGC